MNRPRPHPKLQKKPGGFWILQEGSAQRRVFGAHSASKSWVRFEGRTMQLGSQTSPGAVSQSDAAGEQDLVSQFPGKVRKVFVKKGQKVESGQELLAVEAMKMEFSVKAPFAGTVRAVLVEEGQNLAPGQRMIDMEEG